LSTTLRSKPYTVPACSEVAASRHPRAAGEESSRGSSPAREVVCEGVLEAAHEAFRAEVRANVHRLGADTDLQALSRVWVREITPHKYAYNFTWMGRPIIQFPQDMMAMQEILWAVKPDLVIEAGVAHGGSILYYASLLELIGHGEVLGIDIDIRAHNRDAIESHPMAGRVQLLEGSSIDPTVISAVHEIAKGRRVVVVLDSNHTHEHVLAELEAYAPLVCEGGYCVVMDTIVEHMPKSLSPDRPWGPGDNPMTAVRAFLTSHDEFVVDTDMDAKLLISVAPSGYLRRVK
jgi:cephalosporin hydroxylase